MTISPKQLKIATYYPLIYIPLFFVVVFAGSAMGSESTGFVAIVFFILLFIFHILAMIDIVFLLIYYFIHLWKKSSLNSNKKILWSAVFLCFHIMAFPFYLKKVIEAPPTAEVVPTIPIASDPSNTKPL